MKRRLKNAVLLPFRLVGEALFLVASRLYFVVCARASRQAFNDRVLALALRARGYDNFASARLTGEEAFIRVLARQRPRLCVDVGANRGDYAERLLRETGAHVIAFEPQPAVFASLERLRARYPERLECVAKGVGDRSGLLELSYGEESTLASFAPEVKEVEYVGKVNTRTMQVEVTTLDDFFAGRPETAIDLLKIDTEGFEYEVLAGAARTLAALRPRFVQLEFNWHQLFRGQSLFRLASLLPGYRAYQLLPYGRGLAARDPKAPLSNVYLFSNFVFVRDDVAL